MLSRPLTTDPNLRIAWQQAVLPASAIVSPETSALDALMMLVQHQAGSVLQSLPLLPDTSGTDTSISDALMVGPNCATSLHPRVLWAGCVLVTDQQTLVGILTERDVVRLSARGEFSGHAARQASGQLGQGDRPTLADLSVAEIMTQPVVTVQQSQLTDIFVPLDIIRKKGIRHLPVLDDQGQILGVLTVESLRHQLCPMDLLRLWRVADVRAAESRVTDVACANPQDSMQHLVELMDARQVSSVVLVEAPGLTPEADAVGEIRRPVGIPVGIVTEKDVVQFQSLGLAFESTPAQVVMSTPVITVTDAMSLWDVNELMQESWINRVAIVGANGALEGLLTSSQLINVLNPLELYHLVDRLGSKVTQLEAENLNLLQRRNAELEAALETEIQRRAAVLQAQADQDRLLDRIVNSVQLYSDLSGVRPHGALGAIAQDIRQFLQCDRVALCHFVDGSTGKVIAESAATADLSISAGMLYAPEVVAQWQAAQWQAAQWQAVSDGFDETVLAGLNQAPLLAQVQNGTHWAVPILSDQSLWGVLWVQSDAADRIWTVAEKSLLKRLAEQVAIALQQIAAHEQAQQAQRQRDQREQELQWLYGILQAINEAEDFNAALAIALQQVCELAEWFYGEVWLPDAKGQRLCAGPTYSQNSGSVLQEFSRQSQGFSFAPNQGLPGRVWVGRSPEWMSNVSEQDPESFPRVHLAAQFEIKAACGVPILTDQEVVAVLVLFAPEARDPDERFLALIQSVAIQLGQAMYRKRTREALQRSERTTLAILRAIPDLLIRMDQDGYYQEVLCAGDPDTMLLPTPEQGNSLFDLLPPHLADQKLYYTRQALRTQTVQVYEQELTIHGQFRSEELRITPLNATEVLVIVRDITVRQSALRDRQWAEAALRHSEATNRAIIQSIPDLMLRMNRKGQYLQVLSQGHAVAIPRLNKNPEASVLDLLPPELAQRRLELIEQALDTQTVQAYEQHLVIDGRLHDEDVRITPLTTDDVLVIIRDVSDRKQIELALQSSEARYRLLFEKNPHPMWVYDLDTLMFLAVNEAAITKYGYDRATFLTLSLADIIQADAADWPPMLAILQAPEGIRTGSWVHMLADGCDIVVELVSHPIPFAGRPARLALAQDITQRQIAEEALRQLNQELEDRVAQRTVALQASEERWQLALQSSNAGIWDWDYRTGQVFRSARWAELRGLTLGEFNNSQDEWSRRIHPEDHDYVMAAVADHIAQRTPYYQVEYRIFHTNGHTVWLLDRGQGMWDENGTLVRMVGFETDITQRKQIELAQQASEARYRAVMDGANDVILLADMEGNLVQGNQKAEALLGYSATELAHLHISQLHPPDEWKRAQHCFQTVAQTQVGQQVLDITLITKDQQNIPVDVTCSVIEIAGTFFALGIFRDIRDRKCIEDELRKTAVRLAHAQRIAKLGSWEFDLQTGVIIWSDEVFRIFGIDPAQGAPTYPQIQALIHPDDRDRHQQEIDQAIASGNPYNIEFRFVNGKGDLRHALARGEIFRDVSGHPARLVGTVLDITERKSWEAALQESEARYRAIVEDQTDLICRFTSDGTLTFANLAYCRYFDVPIGDQPISLWSLLAPDVVSIMQAQLKTLSLDVPSISYEEEDIFPNGEVRWQVWTDRAIFDAMGQVLEYQSVGHDITARKRAELALQESEAKLRLFVECAPAAVAMFDQEMRYLVVSNRWQQDYNLGDRPLIGHSHYDIFPETPQRWREVHQQCLAGAVKTEQRQSLVRENGEIDWLRWEVRPWERADGSIGGIIMMTEVITEQILAQERLRNLSDRLALAIRSGAIGIWEREIATNRLQWDDRMYELYDINRESHPTTFAAWKRSVHPDDRGAAEAALERAIAEEVEFDTEFRILTPSGEVRYMKASALIQHDEQGFPERMVGITFEITARRVMEEQLRQSNQQLALTNQELERATRLKDEFLANMSHELRTPLNAILGLSEGLQDVVFGAINAPQSRAIATIESSGRHLLELITDILDLSKIEAGKLDLDYGEVSVHPLCTASLTFVRQMAQKKNIHLDFQVKGTLQPFSADERRLRQVLINLLSNAVKFTPDQGRVTLTVWLEPALQADLASLDPDDLAPRAELDLPRMVAFAVEDNGIGIAASDLSRLFQPFVQLDSSLNRQQAGTGLGLALVRRIVDLHHGTLTVDSKIGQGSRFTVHLPYCPNPTETSPLPAPLPASLLSSNQQVLLIEDSIREAEQLTRYFADLGMQASVQTQGEAALELARTLQPALIVLDLILPSMSGWDLLTQLKQDPLTQGIPVIITSAIDSRAQALALGASAYLVKPISRAQLEQTVETLRGQGMTSSRALIVVTDHLCPEGQSVPQTEGLLALDEGVDPAAQPDSLLLPDADFLPDLDPDIGEDSGTSLRLAQKGRSRPLILIAEDNQANIDSIQDYLTYKGYDLIAAYDGQQALDLAQQTYPDLILMDIQMPHVDGLEAMRWFQQHPSLAAIPIIVLSALAMEADRERCLAAGAKNYLAKPFRLRDLVDAIEALLNP